ncbi:hypothetical protein [Kocuria tytonicola]|uniref:hypothetical protein n=1 Tax=Kocuria tytonicola TaxID=2055946 RepID=UPI000F519C21|nr:hypothetical protein [Kocuria tytonicola]
MVAKFSKWFSNQISLFISAQANKKITEISRRVTESPPPREARSALQRICWDAALATSIFGIIFLAKPVLAEVAFHQNQAGRDPEKFSWLEIFQTIKTVLVQQFSQTGNPSLGTLLSLTGLFVTVSIGVIVSGRALQGNELRVVDALRITQWVVATYSVYFILLGGGSERKEIIDRDIEWLLGVSMLAVTSTIMLAVEGGVLGAKSRIEATRVKEDRLMAEIRSLKSYAQKSQDDFSRLPRARRASGVSRDSQVYKFTCLLPKRMNTFCALMLGATVVYNVTAVVLTLREKSLFLLAGIVFVYLLWAAMLVTIYWTAPPWSEAQRLVRKAWVLFWGIYLMAAEYLLLGPSAYGLTVYFWPEITTNNFGQLTFVALSMTLYFGSLRIIQQAIKNAFISSPRFYLMHAVKIRRNLKSTQLRSRQLSENNFSSTEPSRTCAEMDS